MTTLDFTSNSWLFKKIFRLSGVSYLISMHLTEYIHFYFPYMPAAVKRHRHRLRLNGVSRIFWCPPFTLNGMESWVMASWSSIWFCVQFLLIRHNLLFFHINIFCVVFFFPETYNHFLVSFKWVLLYDFHIDDAFLLSDHMHENLFETILRFHDKSCVIFLSISRLPWINDGRWLDMNLKNLPFGLR